MRLELDCHVECADGPYGGLTDLVIDPASRRLTHLVVQPHGQHELARIVPASRASLDGSSNGGISLSYTIAELEQLEPIYESEYLGVGERPVAASGWSIGIEEVASLASYESPGTAALGAGIEPLDLNPHVIVNYHRVPPGTVEVRRGSEVVASDGSYVGELTAVIVDDRAELTQLVFEHGHLWGKRHIVVPARAIERIECDEIVYAPTRADPASN